MGPLPRLGRQLSLLLPALLPWSAAGGEVLVALSSGGHLGLSTRGPSSFRVRFLGEDIDQAPIDSPMVAPQGADAPFEEVPSGVRSAALGSLLVTGAGEIELQDALGAVLTRSKPVGAGDVALTLAATAEARLYGAGSGQEDATSLSRASGGGRIVNRATYVPYYYSTDGYAALGVTTGTDHNKLLASYELKDGELSWKCTAGAFELHLMPAPSLKGATAAYLALTGGAAVPPRYVFGFAASKWGWESRSYIEETLTKFREGRFPADSFIVDFEWFAQGSDYNFEAAGEDGYQDFGYNPATFPQPRQQLLDYRSRLRFRMGGIRKPRLGNSLHLKKAEDEGWKAPEGGPETYALGRWLSFEDPAMRLWYGRQNSHYLDDGVDYWWNDEGENGYFTYHWWNVAESEALHWRAGPPRRFYSLNRAFTPGMARLGAAVWSGDIEASWASLAQTPGTMLNWGLAGAPYMACDIGGFWGNTTPALLTRWYQVGAFLPIMRVHSTIRNTPHFPWLWGDEAASAMRAALELRYRLLPYHYSLAHAMRSDGSLWMRPLLVDFPDDPQVAELTSQWMDGDILVAPVLRQDSVKAVYLPEGLWYEWRTGTAARGPQRLEGPAGLEEVPAFVRAGAIVTLAPVVQSSEELPGGPLEVRAHAGADGSFALVEDDGETMAYASGAVRTTAFAWDDAARTLRWSRHGAEAVPGAFAALVVVLRDEAGEHRSEVLALAASGSASFGGRRLAEGRAAEVHV